MNHSIEQPRNTQGKIELYGASTHLADAITSNFTDRGIDAARLLVATLTETPYTPTFEGRRFEIEVSNRYRGIGDDESSTPDTVDEAKEALAEFVHARVKGTRRIHLDHLGTGYRRMLGRIEPSWRDAEPYRNAFDEAMVEESRKLGVDVASPTEARNIILHAPRTITGLLLTSRDTWGLRSVTTADHKMVTEDGRIVQAQSTHSLLLEIPKYFMPREIQRRGGRAPGSGIVSEIRDRAVSLRTKHTSR